MQIKKKCSRCKIEKNLKRFNKNGFKGNNIQTWKSYCKDCEKLGKSDLTVYIRGKYSRAVSRHKTQGYPEHLKVSFNKEEWIDEVMRLYNLQNGMCPIKKVKLTSTPGGYKEIREGTYKPEEGAKTNLSIDRIDPSKGYMKGNIMVVCQKFNSQKSDNNLFDMLVFCRHMKKISPEIYNETLKKVEKYEME
tara:strand:+ start:62 stop:634 length:573 start_codon:yes stop_codon:yes gene_type:complete